MDKNKYTGGFHDFIPKILIVVIIFAVGVWVGQNVALPFGDNTKIINLTNSDTPSYVEVDFTPFWDVWNQITNSHLNSKYIDPQSFCTV